MAKEKFELIELLKTLLLTIQTRHGGVVHHSELVPIKLSKFELEGGKSYDWDKRVANKYNFLTFFSLNTWKFFLGWQKKIKAKHKQSGVEKYCHVGYSWTYFFFGFFVPIFRGEISIGIYHLIFSIITFGIFQLVMPFFYNKQSSIRLLTNGWELNDTEENNTLAKVRIGISF